MQGYQFGHIETWSRKGAARQNGQDPKVRRNGQRAWTVDQIIDEAAREPGASEHVGRNRREPTIIPGRCRSFDDLRNAHAEACRAKKSSGYNSKTTGEKTSRTKAVRVDTHTLYTSVISLPVESAEALENEAVMAECRLAFDLAIRFEQRRLEDAGGEFAMAVIHLDERHVHMHIYGLDRQRGSVNGLHPGKAALDAFRAQHGALSSKGSDLSERSRRAYCDALREWQDDLHSEALGTLGMCRYGPRRARYSRAQWTQRKKEEEARADAQRTVNNVAAIRAAQLAAAEAIAAREENVVEMQNRFVAERKELRKERAAVAEKEGRLEAGIATIEAMTEGLLEVDEHEGEPRVAKSPKVPKDDRRWLELRARLKRAPKEVFRVATTIAEPLRRLRTEAAEQGRASAMSAAREELAARFPKLGAIHALAKDLVGRITAPREREEAEDALERAARGEANDTSRFKDENRPRPNIVSGDD